MANLINALKNETNYKYTENGAIAHKSTCNALYDMFAFGGAYRNRSDADVILLFKNAFEENPTYALKCLFYLRDIRGGQGERRFFRLCIKWLANNYPDAMRRNIMNVPEFGRWDDLYELVGTSVEKSVFRAIKKQLVLDMQSKTPSLLAKWLKSENTSSPKSRLLGNLTRNYMNMDHAQYRKVLSKLRKRINVLERLMSAGEWDKIEFDKIPSKAGFIYRNAFARHDVERMRQGAVRSYEDFAKDKDTKVNAKTLYPYEVVAMAHKFNSRSSGWYGNYFYDEPDLNNTERLMVNKYWDNLADYFNGASLNALAIVDTSGSMTWTGTSSVKPIDVAISLGMYCAEKAKGPFHGNYISFASRPQLIETKGVDFVDKVNRIYNANLCDNTNLEAAFDLVLNTALKNKMKQEDLPNSLIVITDLEFDAARGSYRHKNTKTLMENISEKWNLCGYKMPNLIFWCVDSRGNSVPMEIRDGVSLCSGFSPVLFEQIMQNKSAMDLMYDKLNSERYNKVY